MNFEYIIYTLMGTFVVLSIITIIQTFKLQKKAIDKNISDFDRVKELNVQIETLNNKNNNGKTKASAFVTLMHIGHILVHTMVNTGNFDDYQQQKKYNKLVSSNFIKRIDDLEDSDGQFSF